MLLPELAVRASHELYERFKDLAHGDDDARRALTRKLAEQVVFATGDRDWGCKKRAGLGDEWQSKDALAYSNEDGTVDVWDWQNGSTRQSVLVAGSEATYKNIPQNEAAFMPVNAVNHLGWGKASEEEAESESEPDQPNPITEILTKLDEINTKLDKPTPTPQCGFDPENYVWEGRIFGYTLSLKARKVK